MQDFEWVRCPNCTHKTAMIRFVRKTDNIALSIKCPSCKRIVEIAVADGCIMSATVAGKEEPAFVFNREVRAADEN